LVPSPKDAGAFEYEEHFILVYVDVDWRSTSASAAGTHHNELTVRFLAIQQDAHYSTVQSLDLLVVGVLCDVDKTHVVSNHERAVVDAIAVAHHGQARADI
jgi:hypothetical protein